MPKEIFAQANTFSDLGVPNQSVMAQIGFENGVMGHMWISSEFPKPGWPSSEVRFQVVGRDGMLTWKISSTSTCAGRANGSGSTPRNASTT